MSYIEMCAIIIKKTMKLSHEPVAHLTISFRFALYFIKLFVSYKKFTLVKVCTTDDFVIKVADISV